MATAPADPTSLQNLHDIVLPQTVSWWPLAPGWYGLISITLILAIGWGVRQWLRYRANYYRREALLELQRLQQESRIPKRHRAALTALPVLLKRAALSAYPRAEVASLSGASWRHFLDANAASHDFNASAGEILSTLSYRPDRSVSAAEIDTLCAAIEHWLRHHRSAKV
jgi:hypothetical protein